MLLRRGSRNRWLLVLAWRGRMQFDQRFVCWCQPLIQTSTADGPKKREGHAHRPILRRLSTPWLPAYSGIHRWERAPGNAVFVDVGSNTTENILIVAVVRSLFNFKKVDR
jgi:hypothetical protein